MSPHESFTTYANRVMQGNNLLIGTTSRLDTTALRSKLESNMSTYLADKIARLRPTDKERLTAITVFEDWLAEVTMLDDEITADLKRIADFAAEHIVKRQRIDNTSSKPTSNHNSFANPPLSGANAIPPPWQSGNTYNPSRGGYRGTGIQRGSRRIRCPKLLPSEYELLDKHSGCRKCRKFYVNHQVHNCPNDFPNPDTYVTLTEEMALQSMARAAIASTFNGAPPSTTTTPSTLPFSSVPTPFACTLPSAFVEEIPLAKDGPHTSAVQNSIATVLPSSNSVPFVLGNGESDTESNPSSVSPISVPHYICSV